ncbi:anti-sigma regulatory factor (Ser/Thr protein kinase) [Lipingzhangella halophila]|uniref:histidine kinase n=1 Tax=Lipingzhangella halophila TaxID=1783352 RepID=A0A7W7REY5_9ACTN|nr:sensor histidine kinase [Lipingzhangella halophila]MBB4930413.1 anti-sigma regulatory factor (Ser/Thr protein kinase) [Lipingzhangella halophila]
MTAQWPGYPAAPPHTASAPDYHGPAHPQYGYPPQYGYAPSYQSAPPAAPTQGAPESHAPVATPPAPEPASDPPAASASAPHLRTAHRDLLPKALANLAMRDLTLVESLLLLIQRLEEREDDADVLEILYQVDHLGTRMRRNCENLLVMAGEPISSTHQNAIPLHDVSRAAMSEIDKYTRVRIQELPQLHIRDVAADDLSHLLAELMENALANSSDDSEVIVRGRYRDDGGLIVEIADDGIGIPPAKLTRINAELQESPMLTDETLRHMGLFVVGLLAHRHGIEVQLQTRPFSGTSGFVYLPAELVQESQTPSEQGGSGQSMPESHDSPASPAPPASDASAGGTTARADEPLPELPRREPGRGTPGLRVVDGAAQARPAPDQSAPTDASGEPDELPELPRRQPASEQSGDNGSLPQRVPSASANRTDQAEDADDEFVTIRGQPPGGAAPAQEPKGDSLSHAERVRAEFDGYVSGRRAYEENPEPTVATDGTAEDGDDNGAGQHNEAGDEDTDTAEGHSAVSGKADQQ